MSKLCEICQYESETLYVSLLYASKFFSLEKTCTRANWIAQVATACVYISAKFNEEPYEPTATYIVKASKKAFPCHKFTILSLKVH